MFANIKQKVYEFQIFTFMSKQHPLLNNTLHKIIFLGKPFIDLQEEMKHAYAHYCKNYDDVTNLLAQVICNQM